MAGHGVAVSKPLAPALLFSALFFIPVFALFLIPGGSRSIGVYAVSAFLLALALALASWGVGLRRGLSYIGIFPLPKNRGQAFHIAKWAIAAFLLSCLLTGAVSYALQALGILDSQLVEQKLLTLPFPALVIAFTLSPLGEEALFRGYFFKKIAETTQGSGKPSAAAYAAGAMFSSLLFAILHFSYGSIAEILVAFFVGLALCFCTRKSGSLLPAILAHAAFNFLSIIVTVFL